MSGKLADITGPDVPECISEESVILLPIGAIEQHGPHLPMSVDAVIAEETSNALLDQVGDKVRTEKQKKKLPFPILLF